MAKFLKAVLVATILVSVTVSAANAGPVVQGREWRPMSDILGHSFLDFALVCPIDGGACTGALDGVDLVGWSWATALEVAALFHAVSPHDGTLSTYTEFGAQWATDFFDVLGFVPTFVTSNLREIAGWSATRDQTIPVNTAFIPALGDAAGSSEAGLDYATANATDEWGFTRRDAGAWLYRPATVPVPGAPALALVGLGLAGIGLQTTLGKRRLSRDAGLLQGLSR